MLIHGDSVYDIIDKQDHASIQSELMRGIQGNGTTSSGGDNLSGENSCVSPSTERRIFLCRMNVSRNARRQMRFGDQKVVQTVLCSFYIKALIFLKICFIPTEI